MTMQSGQPHTDIQNRVWFDRFLPTHAQPYTRLARFDRPIGAWLLFIPGLWSIAIAATSTGAGWVTVLQTVLIFLAGAILMRGAGCVINDMWDKDLDAKVERTAARPLASGALKRRQALYFLIILLLASVALVVQLPAITVLLAAISLVFVVLYPLAKRVTFWPQAMLGLTFNFGALMGAAALEGFVPGYAIALYVGCFFWTIGYDTIYAHQDREDDLSVGIKSTAILFGTRTRLALVIFYALALASWCVALMLAPVGLLSWLGLLLAAGTLVYQVRNLNIDDSAKCLALFKFSAWTGWMQAILLIFDWITR